MFLHDLDPKSDRARYPKDTSQNRSFENGETVNFLDVNDLFEKSMLFFFHTSDVFSKYTDYKDFIDSIYQDEMRSMD